MIDIRAYENSDEIPEQHEYPNTPWTQGADKYRAALEIEDQESADIHLWMLVGYSLRYSYVEIIEDKRVIGQRKLKWKEAFEQERESLAWRAFARDVGDFALYSTVNGERVEGTTYRDRVWRLFKAQLPERVRTSKPTDILENVHIKREKAAKGRGESYWRKGHAPKPEPEPIQGGLF